MQMFFVVIGIGIAAASLLLGACGDSSIGSVNNSNHNSNFNVLECGNGLVEGSEDCDLFDLDNATCADVIPNSAGTLLCTSQCTFNITGCATGPVCGNGIHEFGEGCDCGTDPLSLPAVCPDVNGGADANCTSDCERIAYCGDGAQDPGEACDGDDHGIETCESLGLAPGLLVCMNYCTFNTSGCGAPSVCGNGTIEGNEECDLFELGGDTCVTQGFSGGSLSCTVSCTFNTNDCWN